MSAFLVTRVGPVLVSTVYRESSAMVNSPPWYFETMAWHDREPGIAWQSAAGYRRQAFRQHWLAVRWFGRHVDHALAREEGAADG